MMVLAISCSKTTKFNESKHEATFPNADLVKATNVEYLSAASIVKNESHRKFGYYLQESEKPPVV